MAGHGGPRPGSGRKKGKKLASTLAKEAEAELQRAQAAKRKLGVDVLHDLMTVFVNVAVKYQPRVDEQTGRVVGDEDKFEKWATLAMECASRKAPYETPKLRAVMVSGIPEEPASLGPPPPKVIEGKAYSSPAEAYRLLLAPPTAEVVEMPKKRKTA